MKKSWGFIPKILSKEKTIESRWYNTRRTPWDKVHKGDTVYFKNSGEPVIAEAKVSKVLQFSDLNPQTIREITDKYGKSIGLQNHSYQDWSKGKKYCVLIFLKDAEKIKPFAINKTGFGIGAAWVTINNINKIKITDATSGRRKSTAKK